MSHYKSNVRDQVFNLFEVLGVDKVFGEGEYADLDVDTAKEMLGEMARLAEGPIAESFVEGDRNEAVLLARRRARRTCHWGLKRIVTERACASSPSASPSAIAAGPSARN